MNDATQAAAVAGKLPASVMDKLFPGEIVVKQKKPTKLGKQPKHLYFLVVGSSMVRIESEAQQQMIRAALGKNSPPKESAPPKTDAASTPPAKQEEGQKEKSFWDSL